MNGWLFLFVFLATALYSAVYMYNRSEQPSVRNRLGRVGIGKERKKESCVMCSNRNARNLIRHDEEERNQESVDFDGLRWMMGSREITEKNVLTVGRVDWPSAVIAPQ
jgi:hypothetical protein